jgi:catechol-2,3-dioxygenase
MSLAALGYVGIRAKDLGEWATYGTNFLGMQLVEQTGGTLTLRMDDRKQRVIVHADGDDAPSFYGWEVADAAALDALAAHLQNCKVDVARGSRALASERRVTDLIVFADPIGNRLEAFYGAEIASEPFKPGTIHLRLPHRPAWHGARRAHGRTDRRRHSVLHRYSRFPP